MLNATPDSQHVSSESFSAGFRFFGCFQMVSDALGMSLRRC